MIAQWENERISLSVFFMAWVQLPAVAEYFKEFSLADHTLLTRDLNQCARRKMAQSPSPYHTTHRHRGGRQKFNHRQTMAGQH